MSRRTASDCVHSARANVHLATKACGAAEMSQLQRGLQLLETAAADILEAAAGIRSSMPKDPAALRLEITLMKREIAGMMRVIDGCAAVCRGLSVQLGCTALSYTPQGHAVATPSTTTACGLQG